MSQLKRLSLVDCIAIGVNGIVGSGIFSLPNWVATGALAFGPLAFVVCGALCLLVGLCFAEVSGMFDRSGGPYLYAREAFGDAPGFAVGWMTFASAILGYAAVARALGEEVAGAAGFPPFVGAPLAMGLMVVLGALNYRGVKSGARTSDFLSIAKVVPLLVFVAVGLFAVKASAFRALGTPSLAGFAEGTFSCVFALTGFEFVTVVAGETENPKRNIPIALVGSLVGAVILYSLIQVVATGTLPGLTAARAPLVDSARAFGGDFAASGIRAVAIVSMLGFCSGSALVVPRFISTLAQDGILPRQLSEMHPTLGTPTRAIAFVTLLAVLFAAFFPFKALADLTVLTIFAQYVPTCLALLKFRRTRPDAPRSFRVPFGPVIPLLASAVVAFLLFKIKTDQFLTAAVILGLGAGVFVANRAKARVNLGA